MSITPLEQVPVTTLFAFLKAIIEAVKYLKVRTPKSPL